MKRTASVLALALLSVVLSTALHTGNSPTLAHTTTTPTTAIEGSHATAATAHTLDETVQFLRTFKKLPPYYLTKNAAAARGWNPSTGNLCDVAPGMMIGGDIFSNTQHLLPSVRGRVWREADFDYSCGTRNAKRILYSSDGLIYTTVDHYQTVTQII